MESGAVCSGKIGANQISSASSCAAAARSFHPHPHPLSTIHYFRGKCLAQGQLRRHLLSQYLRLIVLSFGCRSLTLNVTPMRGDEEQDGRRPLELETVFLFVFFASGDNFSHRRHRKTKTVKEDDDRKQMDLCLHKSGFSLHHASSDSIFTIVLPVRAGIPTAPSLTIVVIAAKGE